MDPEYKEIPRGNKMKKFANSRYFIENYISDYIKDADFNNFKTI